MNKPTLKECFADNGEHSHWELIDTDTGKVLWTEEEKDCIEFKSIKSIKQGNGLCFDDFRNEKIVHIAKDKILFKTDIEEFCMPLSGHRTGKRYFAIVLDNGEAIYCNETEFDKI